MDTPHLAPVPDLPPTENWYRQLKDDRIEVCLKAEGLRMRASGPEVAIWRLIEVFEQLTGAQAVGNWKRPLPKGPRQLDGQIAMLEEPSEE